MVFLDNAPSHTETDELLDSLQHISTSLTYFPKYNSLSAALRDTGILKLFKKIWRDIWEQENFNLFEQGKWVESGNLGNMGKL